MLGILIIIGYIIGGIYMYKIGYHRGRISVIHEMLDDMLKEVEESFLKVFMNINKRASSFFYFFLNTVCRLLDKMIFLYYERGVNK